MIWFLTLDWVPKGGWIIGSSGWLIGWGLAENWLLISYFPGPGTACELKARIKVTFKVFLSESLINFVLFLVEHGFVSRSLFVGWTTLYHQGSLTNKIMLAVIMGGGGRGIPISKWWGCFSACLGVKLADFGLTLGIQEETSIFLPIP